MTIKDDLIKEIEEGHTVYYLNRKVYENDDNGCGFGLYPLDKEDAKKYPKYIIFNITSGLCRSKDEAVRIFRLRLATHNPPKSGRLYWRQELTMESNQCFDNDETEYRLSCQFAVSEQV